VQLAADLLHNALGTTATTVLEDSQLEGFPSQKFNGTDSLPTTSHLRLQL
jgi:hypothetical protein